MPTDLTIGNLLLYIHLVHVLDHLNALVLALKTQILLGGGGGHQDYLPYMATR